MSARRADVLPRERAVHVVEAARLELALGELAHGADDLLLLVGQLEAKGFGHRRFRLVLF